MSATGDDAQSIKVLSNWRSMFGMRVLIALKEKGLPYDYQEEDLQQKSQLLLQYNPIYKKVPVLLHHAKPICESLIILQYIDETWPSPHTLLLPHDPYDRAMARFWADYVDKKVYDAGARIFMNADGSDTMEQGKRDFAECFVTLDGALRDVFGGGPYFGGKQIGLVDIALAPFICWLETFETIGKFKALEESKCPHLFAWAQTVVHYPSVKETFLLSPSHKLLEDALAFRKSFLGL